MQILLDIGALVFAYAIASSASCIFQTIACDLDAIPSLSQGLLTVLPLFSRRFINVLPFLAVSTVVFLYFTRSYRSIGISRPLVIVRQTGLTCLLTGAIFWAFLPMYAVYSSPYLRFVSFFLPALWLFLVLNRMLLFRYIQQRVKEGKFTDYFLVVGTTERIRHAAQLFQDNAYFGMVVTGALSDNRDDLGKEFLGTKVVGHIDDFSVVLEKNVVDCVVYAGGINDVALVGQLARRCETIGVDFALMSSLLSDKRKSDFFVEELDGFSLIKMNTLAHSPLKLFAKRLIDVVASAVLIVAFIPVWIVLPIVIRMESRGPALFRQERVGKHGRRFTMYKFRSMVIGADKMQAKLAHLNEMDGPVFKIENDPRFTRLGKFLRKTSLDELPQLFNVFRGDMSLVGPRPPLYSEVVHYRPWERKRLSVTPGITCLWQVTGRNQIKFDEWMKLDIQYIDNWSLTLDLKILVRTIPAVFLRKGAQ